VFVTFENALHGSDPSGLANPQPIAVVVTRHRGEIASRLAGFRLHQVKGRWTMDELNR
jgi:hypothetical protein